MPTLSPPVAGSWAVLSPSLLAVPGDRAARARRDRDDHRSRRRRAASSAREGQHLAQTVTSQFTVAPGSTLRLQQLLAELGYLPLTFTPAAPADLADPGGQRPGGVVLLALAEPAALAD